MRTLPSYCYRKRYGRGFQYFDEFKNKITCPVLLKQIKSLVVPPMWQDVKISTNRSTKIQATGRDAKGRKQYIYNEKWQLKQQRKKFAKMPLFAENITGMRAFCKEQTNSFSFDRTHLLATLVRILDETGIRVGNKRYTEHNHTYGLSTLRTKHLIHKDDNLTFKFIGKSHKDREITINDPELERHVRAFAEQPGYNLFRYKDSSGFWQDISSEDINAFIKSKMGEAFSAKDFRTWFASCLAVEAFYRLEDSFSHSRRTAVNQVISDVAKTLGNTPSVCKAYYIHPTILQKIEHKEMPKAAVLPDSNRPIGTNAEHDNTENGLSVLEQTVLDII